MRCVALLALLMISSLACAQDGYWVSVDHVYVRTCPSERCGEIGYAFLGEKRDVYEIVNNWARVSEEYDAHCENGVSKYIRIVGGGNSACTKSNGINNGKFHKWIPVKSMSKKKPIDPAIGAKGIEVLVANSQDYRIYKKVFVDAAKELIDKNICNEKDFHDFGGFMRSTIYRDKPIYFTYCGGMYPSNKIHLDVSNGKISKGF